MYWSKINFFHTAATAFNAPVGRVAVGLYCHKVWYGKIRLVWISDGGKKFED